MAGCLCEIQTKNIKLTLNLPFLLIHLLDMFLEGLDLQSMKWFKWCMCCRFQRLRSHLGLKSVPGLHYKRKKFSTSLPKIFGAWQWWALYAALRRKDAYGVHCRAPIHLSPWVEHWDKTCIFKVEEPGADESEAISCISLFMRKSSASSCCFASNAASSCKILINLQVCNGKHIALISASLHKMLYGNLNGALACISDKRQIEDAW